MTADPTPLRAAREAADAADARWHEAAVATRAAELAVRAATGADRDAASAALDAAMHAERDAEGVYRAAWIEYEVARDAYYAAAYPPVGRAS